MWPNWMVTRMFFTTGLLVGLIASVISVDPVDNCAPKQCSEAVKFAYEPGWSYIYNYEANVVSSISGTSEDFTSIFIEAQVEIHVREACEFQLKLRNVDLRSRDRDDPAPRAFAVGHAEFRRALEAHPLQFTFRDGLVEDLCADSEDKPWVLNVKRGIVSAVQNTAKSLWRSSTTMERDVLGECPTDYQVDYTWTTITVTKTKDLDHCLNRHTVFSGIQSTPYTSPKGGMVAPVLNSSHVCEQTIEDGILQRVSCSERHLLRPFANGDSGAQTSTKQTLVLIDHVRRPYAEARERERRGGWERLAVTSLLFDFEYEEPSRGADALRDAEAALAQLCSRSRAADAPSFFWRLCRRMQALNYEALTKLFNDVDRICGYTPRGQKFFRDALPLVGTVASVTLMKDLILDHSVPDTETNSWIGTLAFHPRPSKDILKAALPLLTSTVPLPKSILSLSALTHSYCHQPGVVDCEATEEVTTILGFVEGRLGHSCRSDTPAEADTMVTALKALGNLGLYKDSLPVLERCVRDTNNPTTVRLAGIQAYRRIACHVPRAHLMSTFVDTNEDVEIRIAAYLATMKCPDRHVVEDILSTLRDERVSQVNSFVWSHLNAIRKNADPEAKMTAAILADVILQDKYAAASDVRKFSQAFQVSTFSEILNAGAHLEGHVVYEPSAFLPRSAMLNLTVNLFGQAVNLLEVEGRAQGFERLAESLFRLDPNPAKQPDDGTGFQDDAPMNGLVAMVQASNKMLASGSEAFAAIKMFGQEVWHFHGTHSYFEDAVRRLKNFQWPHLLVQLAQDNTIEVMRDVILVDAFYVVPTAAGLPLSLAINATASAHLKIGGRLDMREMATGEYDIEGQLWPSGAVALQASMMVDGYVGTSGVKLEATLSTSPYLDGKVKLTSQGHMKVHLNVPQDRIDFILVSSDLILTHWGRDRVLQAPFDKGASDVQKCSSSLTDRPLGIELCVQLKYVNASLRPHAPHFPLTGPLRLGYWLQKTDPSLTSYLFEYIWDMHENPGSASSSNGAAQTFVLSFRTPQSTVDREWTAEYILNKQDNSVVLRFLTPFKKVNVKGRYFDSSSRIGLFTDIDVDGQEAFSFQSDLTIDAKEDGHTHYQPKVLLRVPSHTVLSLQGLVRHQPDRHLHVDLSVEHFTLTPIIFRGEVSVSETEDNTRYEATFDSPMLNFSLKGFLNPIDGGLSSKTNIEYQLTDEGRETVDVTVKVRYLSPPSRSLTTLSATLDVHTSALPDYNCLVTWEYQFAENHLENTLLLDRMGNNRRVQLARFQQILSYNGTVEHNKVLGKLELKIPSKNIFFLVNIDHQNNERMFHSKVHLKKSVAKEYALEVRFVDESKDTWKTSGRVKVVIDGRATGLSIVASEDQLSDGPPRYVLQADCFGHLIRDANVSLNYTNRSQRLMFSHALRLSIVGPSVKVHSFADLLLTDSRGILMVDTDVNDHKYRLNGDYTRMNPTEHELSLSLRSTLDSYSGRFLIGTGEEKTISFDLRSANQRRLEGEASWLLAYDVKSSSLHLAWDPENDPSRSLNFSIRHERQPELTDTKLDFIYLLSAFRFTLDHHQQGVFQAGLFDQASHVAIEFDGMKRMGLDLNLHHSLVSKEGQQMNGYFEIQTPMSVLHNLVINASHVDEGRSWKSLWSMLVNKEIPFQMSSSGKSWQLANQLHAEATANLDTPFPGLETISLSMTHDVASRETRTSIQLRWSPTDIILVDARTVRPGTSYDFMMATLNITTPFTAYQDMRAGVKYSLSAGHVDSRLHWSHNNKDSFCITINGDVRRKEHRHEILGAVLVVTPLEGFEKMMVNVSHAHDGSSLRTNIKYVIPKHEPFSIQIEVNRRLTSSGFSLHVHGEEVRFGVSGHLERRDAAASGFLKSHWKQASVNVTFDGLYNSLVDLGMDVFIKTSFVHLERTSVSIRNNIGSGHVGSWAVVNLSSAKTGVNVDTTWDMSLILPFINATLEIDGPFVAMRHVAMNVLHGQRDYRNDGNIEISLPISIHFTWNDMYISVHQKLTSRNWLNFNETIHISLPFDTWTNLQLIINQTITKNMLKSSIHLTKMDEVLVSAQVRGNCSWTSHCTKTMSGIISASSDQLLPIKQVQIMFSNRADGQEYHPVLSWMTPDRDMAMTITGYVKLSPENKVIRLIAKSNIPGYEEMGMSGMYFLHDTQIRCAASAMWYNSSRIEVESEVHIDLMAPRFKLHTITPFEGYRIFKLDGSYNAWSSQKHASAIVVKDDWSFRITGNGTFEKDFLDSRVTLETSNPYSDHLIISLNSTGLWKAEMKSVKIVLSWGLKTVTVAIALQPTARGYDMGTVLSASLQTNAIAEVHNGNLVVKVYHKRDQHFMSEVALGWNNFNSVVAHFSVQHSIVVPFNITATVRSSTSSIPPIVLSFLVQDTVLSQELKSTVQIGESVTSVALELNYPTKGKTGLAVNLILPSASFPEAFLVGTFEDKGQMRYHVLIQLKLPAGDLKLHGMVQSGSQGGNLALSFTGQEQHQVAISYNNIGKGFNLEMDTTSNPVSQLWNLVSLKLQYQRTSSGHVVQGGFSDGRGYHKFHGELSGASSSVHLKAVIQSPVLVNKEGKWAVEISFEPHGRTSTLQGSITISDGNEEHLFHLITSDPYAKDSNGYHFGFTADTSLIPDVCKDEKHAVNVTIHVTHLAKGVLGSVGLTMPCERYIFDGRYERDPDNGLSVFFINIVTPLEEFSRLKIDAHHDGLDWDNIDVSLSLVTPIKHYEKFSTAFRTFHVRGSSFELDVLIDTPFRGYENISLTENLQYSMDLKGFATSTNITYEGLVVGFGGTYNRTGNAVDIGVDCHWRPYDIYSESSTAIGDVELRLWRAYLKCPEHQQSEKNCLVEITIREMPWEVEGFWNYSGWRKISGMGSIRTPLEGAENLRMKVENYLPQNKGVINGLLGLQWKEDEVILLNYGGTMSTMLGGKFEGDFNISTPFHLFQRANGHIATIHASRGIVGSGTLNVDNRTVLDGILEWVSDENNVWKNRTVLIELDNILRPFGINFVSSLASRHSYYRALEANLNWNLTHRSPHNSAKMLFELTSGRSQASSTEVHLTVRHPRHLADLWMVYTKTDRNFEHSTTVLWGINSTMLMNYKVWRVLRQDGSVQEGGLRWSHPGRTLQLLMDHHSVHSDQRQTNFDFWWDVDNHPHKRITVNVNCSHHSIAGKRMHELEVLLHSPTLNEAVKLQANASVGIGSSIFDAQMEFSYSPDVRNLFVANTTFATTPGITFGFNTQHESSGLESGVLAKVFRDPETALATMTLWRKTSTENHLEEIYVSTKVDYILQQATIQVDDRANGTDILLGVHQNGPNNLTAFIMEDYSSNKPKLIANVVYLPDNPSITANMSITNDGSLYLRSGLQSPTVGSFSVIHFSKGGKGIADVMLNMYLNTSHLFTLDCHWSPNVTTHLQEAISQNANKVRGSVSGFLRRMWTVSVQENVEKSLLVLHSLTVALQPVVDEALSEIEALQHDAKLAQEYIKDVYLHNDFFVQDMSLFLEKWNEYTRHWHEGFQSLLHGSNLASLYNGFSRLLQGLHDTMSSLLISFNEWLGQRWQDILHILDHILSSCNHFWVHLGHAMYRGYNYFSSALMDVTQHGAELTSRFTQLSSVGSKLKNIFLKVKSTLASMLTWIKGTVEYASLWLVTNDVYVFAKDFLTWMVVNIKDFFTVDVYKVLEKFLTNIKRFMSLQQQRLMDKVYADILALRNSIGDLPGSVMRHPIFDQVTDVTASTYQKGLWMLRYTKMIPRGWETIFRVYSDLVYTFGTKLEEVSDTFDSPNYVLVAPEKRKVQMVQALPFPWKTLRQLPNIGQMKELQVLYRLWRSTQAAKPDEELPTLVPPIFVWWNDVVKKLDIYRWLPPFDAQAMLAGRQHYISFDDQVTEFAGPCSYLLTRDFLDGNFSVIVNYDGGSMGRPTKRSITVMLDGHTIEILSNFQVTLDDKKVELPQAFGHTRIFREVNRLTVVYGYGFSISCHVAYDVCSFTVSGWYLGRLHGLLGTYDYEAVSDITMPNGRILNEDIVAWGNSWRVDLDQQSCQASSNFASQMTNTDPQVLQLCTDYFNSSRSIFRHCYNEVNPFPYMNMCQNDVQTIDRPEDMCTSAAAYIKRCLSRSTPVRIPKLCIRCPISDGTTLVEGDAKIIKPLPSSKKADVVFIVEAKRCNKELPRIYADFVAAVDRALKRAGLVQRRFATVLFGGSGAYDEPYIHTFDSQIFVPQRTVSGLHNFVVGRGLATVFDAFRFSSKLPFQAGSSKTFVLVACSIGDDVEMKMDYPEVHWLLLEDGITLHLLLDREFDVKKPEVFYGVDGEKAFTAKDSRSHDLKGDSDLRRQVSPPKDLHVPIALEVNGTIFSSLHLYRTKQASKRFLDVFSRRLAQSASMDVCHNCECFPDDVGVGRLYCHPCVFPRPAHVYLGSDYGVDDGEFSLLRPGHTGEEDISYEDDTSVDYNSGEDKVRTDEKEKPSDVSKQSTKFRKFKEHKIV